MTTKFKTTAKILATLFVVLGLIFTSCKKSSTGSSSSSPSSTTPACQTNNYGTITISNSSTNPYDIDIDGVYQMRLSGGSISAKINISGGNNRKLHCIQVSGYVFTPTEKTTYFNVVSCSDYSWQIP